MTTPPFYHVADFGAAGDGITDDTAAINAAIAACAQNRGGVVLFDAKTYLVDGALQGETDYCCRLIVPPNVWATIELRGAHLPPQIFGTVGATVLPEIGTLIKSTALDSGGAILGSGASHFVHCSLKICDMTFRTVDNPRQSAIDARTFTQLIAENLQIDTGTYSVQAAEPMTADVFGLRTPIVNNSALTILRNLAISGYWGGVEVGEHTYADYLNLTANKHGLVFRFSHHASFFDRVAAQRNQNAVTVTGANPFEIKQLNIEHPHDDQVTPETAWQKCDGVQGFDVLDTQSAGIGEIKWWVVALIR